MLKKDKIVVKSCSRRISKDLFDKSYDQGGIVVYSVNSMLRDMGIDCAVFEWRAGNGEDPILTGSCVEKIIIDKDRFNELMTAQQWLERHKKDILKQRDELDEQIKQQALDLSTLFKRVQRLENHWTFRWGDRLTSMFKWVYWKRRGTR
jgi:hypothetical protein